MLWLLGISVRESRLGRIWGSFRRLLICLVLSNIEMMKYFIYRLCLHAKKCPLPHFRMQIFTDLQLNRLLYRYKYANYLSPVQSYCNNSSKWFFSQIRMNFLSYIALFYIVSLNIPLFNWLNNWHTKLQCMCTMEISLQNSLCMVPLFYYIW